MMKLYYHPVSTTCRPILLFAADENIALDLELVDLFTGAHQQLPFSAVNPSQQVPVLEDDGFVLSEASAILKYLADKAGSAAYPQDLRQRARINECMDWFNTGLYRELGYNLIYPQVLPHCKRKDPNAQAETLASGREKSQRWLGVLDQSILGANAYVCGAQISIADYLGIGMITVGEVIRLDYSPWKNVTRWINSMKARPNWGRVNEGFYAHFVAPYKDAPFEGLVAP
jgi:glutathione S-transferase